MSPGTMIIDATTVEARLPMAACVDLMAQVQVALSRGEIDLPLRTVLPVAGGSGFLAVMPGELRDPAIFGCKLLSLFPDNPSAGRPAIQGQILLFDGESGTPTAIVEASSVTAIRTAAASGAATRALARPESRALALLGYGVQAASHLEAVRAVRPIGEVRVWGPSREKAASFAAREAERTGLSVVASSTAEEAVKGADVICTVSSAREPILEGGWLDPGVHVNLVGAHGPQAREANAEVLRRSRIFTEVTDFALAEAGDLLLAIEEGGIARSDIVGEIGEVLDGRVDGRRTREDITVYKSLGNVAQDLAAAHFVCSRS